MSKGCKVSPCSLHDDFAGHLRVNRAKVRICSRFAEGEGKLLVRIEHLGFKDPVCADYRVWNIVAIGPRYGRSHRDRQGPRTKAEVIDFHLRCFRLLFSACQNAPLADAGDRKSTRLNSSHRCISYAVFCLKKKTNDYTV